MIKGHSDLSKLQQIQLDILKELDRVCRDKKLTYCLAWGSCLGAVRHKGFIPWDDDIDVFMPMEDFRNLQKYKDFFQAPYFLQTYFTEPDMGLMIGRLRNSNTTLIEESEKDRDINHGIFIDIYPLFHSPKDGWKAKQMVFASMVYRLMIYNAVPQNQGNFMKIASCIILYVTPQKVKKWLIKQSYKVICSYKKRGYLSGFHGTQANIRYPEEWFFPVQQAVFEGLEVPVPANPHAYLTKRYGDYMKLPPESQRKIHHSYLCLDFENSYIKYKGKYYCVESQKK